MVNIPVVFTFDKRILPAATVAIKSLADNAKSQTTYNIHIFHSDIELKFQKELTNLLKNTKHNISFNYIDPLIFKGLKKNNKSWTEIVYYRLIIPEILQQYDKVIYSDVDVFFKKDLSEVFSLDIENYELGAVRAEKNSPEVIGHKYFSQNKNEFIYWSGFLLLNCKKLREEQYFEKFMETARKFKDKLKYFDLDVLNITCNNVFPVSIEYCVLETLFEYDSLSKVCEYEFLNKVYSDTELQNAKNNPAIIHYAGELGKPWRRKKVPQYYEKYLNNIPKSLKKYTLRDIRKKLFSKV